MSEITHKTALELESEYGGIPDEQLVARIGKEGEDSWRMLFYLLFGRYESMLEAVFATYAGRGLDFDDFMLELHVKMGRNDFGAVTGYKGTALFKTYLSTVARNLLFDIGKREKPTIDISSVHDLPCEDNYERERMEQLLEIINAWPDETARLILFKTIEGYTSKEIAQLLSEQKGEEFKPSNVDAIRSRTYKKIRQRIERKKESVFASEAPRMAMRELICEEMVSYDAMPAPVFLDSRYTILPALRSILGY